MGTILRPGTVQYHPSKYNIQKTFSQMQATYKKRSVIFLSRLHVPTNLFRDVVNGLQEIPLRQSGGAHPLDGHPP